MKGAIPGQIWSTDTLRSQRKRAEWRYTVGTAPICPACGRFKKYR